MGLRVEQVAALGFSVDEVVVLQKTGRGGKVETLFQGENSSWVISRAGNLSLSPRWRLGLLWRFTNFCPSHQHRY